MSVGVSARLFVSMLNFDLEGTPIACKVQFKVMFLDGLRSFALTDPIVILSRQIMELTIAADNQCSIAFQNIFRRATSRYTFQ